MIAACPRCSARYRVQRERLTGDGVRLRCARCEAVFRVRAPRGAPPEAAAPQRPALARHRPAGPAAERVAPRDAPTPQPGAAGKPLVLLGFGAKDGLHNCMRMLETRYQPELLRDGVQLLLEIFRRSPAWVVLGDGLARMHAAEVTELLKRSGKTDAPRTIWVGHPSDAFVPGFAPDHQVDDIDLLDGLGLLLGVSPAAAAPPEVDRATFGDRTPDYSEAPEPHAKVPRHAVPSRDWRSEPEPAARAAAPQRAPEDDPQDAPSWKPDARSLESFEAELGEPAPARAHAEHKVPPVVRPPAPALEDSFSAAIGGGDPSLSDDAADSFSFDDPDGGFAGSFGAEDRDRTPEFSGTFGRPEEDDPFNATLPDDDDFAPLRPSDTGTGRDPFAAPSTDAANPFAAPRADETNPFAAPSARGAEPADPFGAPAAPSAPEPGGSDFFSLTPDEAQKPPPPPAPGAGPVPGLDPVLADMRSEAERFARIVVSDIVLYNEAKFAAAVEGGKVLEVMRAELEEGRDLFRVRVDPRIRDERDFLADEILRVAATRAGR